MTLLSLDPSSTRTGYALFDGSRVVEAGYIKAALAAAVERIQDLADEVSRLVEEWRPETTVIEVSTAARASSRIRSQSLVVYGMAVGAVIVAARRSHSHHECVEANVWTRGVPKRTRQRRLAMEFPEFASAFNKDSGGDVADAIGLGLWWLGQSRIP